MNHVALIQLLKHFEILGTNWMVNLLTFMLRSGNLDDIKSVQAFNFEFATPEELAAFTRPRKMNSHMMPSLWPVDAINSGRIVLLFRNPKDTVVSLFHFLQKERLIGEGLDISWNCFIEKWMNSSRNTL